MLGEKFLKNTKHEKLYRLEHMVNNSGRGLVSIMFRVNDSDSSAT